MSFKLSSEWGLDPPRPPITMKESPYFAWAWSLTYQGKFFPVSRVSLYYRVAILDLEIWLTQRLEFCHVLQVYSLLCQFTTAAAELRHDCGTFKSEGTKSYLGVKLACVLLFWSIIDVN